MAAIHESYARGNKGKDTRPDIPPEFREAWPNMAELLKGTFDTEKQVVDIPPMSIAIFVEADRMKFCITSQKAAKVAFGIVQDPSKPMDSIEAALASERFEWKVKR